MAEATLMRSQTLTDVRSATEALVWRNLGGETGARIAGAGLLCLFDKDAGTKREPLNIWSGILAKDLSVDANPDAAAIHNMKTTLPWETIVLFCGCKWFHGRSRG